jgi:glycosyltransferase involved in cell wall biosynthesis
MRLAIFTDGFYPELGGIQDSVKSLAEALGKRGNDVVCVVPAASRKDYERSHIPYGRELDLGERVRIIRVPSVPMGGSGQQMRFVPPTFARWRLLREFRPDVIHTQTFFGLGFEALRAARKLGVPLVGTNHSAVGAFKVYAPFWKDRMGAWAVRGAVWYYNKCDIVSGPSRSVLDEMVEHGLAVPHEVVSNPIDDVTFRSRTEDERAALKKKFDLSAHTLVYAGRLALEKNIDVILRALPIVRARVPDILFALAGHGADGPRLRQLAQDLGIAQSVRFLGTIPQPQLSEVFAASEAFVIASMSETQSMVLLQAGLCSLPAVGIDWRSFPEYIHADSGFLAKALDHRDFAAKTIELLEDNSRRIGMGEAASRYASQYSPDAVAAHWERIYERVISARR